MHGGRVDDVELGPIRDHDPDGVAVLQPEPGESGGELAYSVGELRPGDGVLVLFGPDGDPVRKLGSRHLEGPAHRGLLERLVDEALALGRRRRHLSSVSPYELPRVSAG